MWKVILTLVGIFLFSPAYAADHPLLSAKETSWLRQHPAPLRVHNENNWIPFNFNESGKPLGYSIDYMNLLAEKLGLQLEYVSGPSWSEFLEMMKDGSLDIMVNIASTKERRRYLVFTEPYYITKTALFILKTNTTISDLNDLAGKKIGFTEGFFFSEFLKESYPNIELVTFDSTLASFIGVDKGLVDAALEIPVVGQRILQESALSDIKQGGIVTDPRFITTFYIATRKANPILRDIIQKGMDAVSPEEELAIRQKWKIEESDSAFISKAEKTYLADRKNLTICINPNRLPLEAVNMDGTVTGISSEFLKLLAEQMNIDFSVVKTKTWDETLVAAEKGQCDLLPMISKTSARQKYLNFSSPWLTTPLVIATRQDQIYISNLKQVTDQKFGVVKGLAAKDIVKKAYPELNLVTVNSVQDGLREVEDENLFGLIGTIPAISRALQTNSITGVKISGNVGLSIDFAVGVKKNDPQLLNIVNESLAAIGEDAVANIYNRWLSVAYIDRFDYTRFWQVTAAFLLLTLYLLYRHRHGVQITTRLRKAHAEIEAVNLKLTKQARTDTLTRIANRLKIDEVLNLELARFQRNGEPFSVILLDIDHFKRVNDNYGHHTGDNVLQSIATILQEHTRKYDLAGRWGGEEFLIICPSMTDTDIIRKAEQLRQVIMDNRYEELPPQTASFGVATVRDEDSVTDLIKRADEALYRAKEGGRNRVET